MRLDIFFSLATWNDNQCGSAGAAGAQIFVERVANANRMANGGPPMEFVDCAANLPMPLQSNRAYAITVTVTDDTRLGYTVTDRAEGSLDAAFPLHDYGRWYICPFALNAGTLSPDIAYCANPMSPDRFANSRTGYLIWPLFSRQQSNSQGPLEAVTVQ